MATIFWDGEEVILVDIMPCGQTINSDLYTVSPKIHSIISEAFTHKNLLKSSFNTAKHDHKA